jgi:uncharacterized phage protein (TIGR02218 family)
MKSISPAFLAHLKGGATTLGHLWHVKRTDNVVFGYTDLDRDIVYNDGNGLVTYLASTGITPSSVDSTAELSVDNLEMQGILDSSTITEADLLAGVWDLAEVIVYRVNYRDLSMGHEILSRGRLGEVSTGRNAFKAELRGLTQNLQQQYAETVQPLCTAIFCDTRCKLMAINYTVGGTVTTGISRQSFLTDLSQPVNFFAHGKIKFLTGANHGLIQDVKFFSGYPSFSTLTQKSVISGGIVTVSVPGGKSFARDYGVVDSTLKTYTLTDTPASSGDYSPSSAGVYSFNQADNGKTVTITYAVQEFSSTPGGQVDLQLEMPYPVAFGDTFEITEGCDKRIETCASFNNVVNFRGFPHLPGRDRLISGKSR